MWLDLISVCLNLWPLYLLKLKVTKECTFNFFENSKESTDENFLVFACIIV